MIPLCILTYEETMAELKTWSSEMSKSADASKFKWAE
jgi:hypothetical protein